MSLLRAWNLFSLLIVGVALRLPDSSIDTSEGLQNTRDALENCAGLECVQRYVNYDDGTFHWSIEYGAPGYGEVTSSFGAPVTKYILKVFPGEWYSLGTRANWELTVNMFVPVALSKDSAQAGWATLFLHEPPWLGERIAAHTGAVSIIVKHVPPNNIKGARGIYEAELAKVKTWQQFDKDPTNPSGLIEMPSVKAAVKVMDVVANFSEPFESQSPYMPRLERFIVSGMSKRGIASYMVGAIDSRVKGIMPVCHPVSLDAIGRESYENLGEIADSAKPYDWAGVHRMAPDVFKRMEAIIDPITYIQRLTMPALVMAAGQDQFFFPDSSRQFFSTMPSSDKAFYMYPNAGHQDYGEGPNDFVDVAETFVTGLVRGIPRPVINWTIDETTGDIMAYQVSNHTPSKVTLWVANSIDSTKRDFRSSVYARSKAYDYKDRTWHAHQMPSSDGRWTAFYFTFEYEPIADGLPGWKTSTEVSVVPTYRPFQHQRLAESERTNYIFR